MHLPLSWATAPRVQALATLHTSEAAPGTKLLCKFDKFHEEGLLVPGLIVRSDQFRREDRILTPEEEIPYTWTSNTSPA